MNISVRGGKGRILWGVAFFLCAGRGNLAGILTFKGCGLNGNGLVISLIYTWTNLHRSFTQLPWPCNYKRQEGDGRAIHSAAGVNPEKTISCQLRSFYDLRNQK
jgi:hypothetical protein